MDQAFTDKQQNDIASEFNWIKDKCYLDNAGAALYSSTQIQNIAADLCLNLYGNPHTLNNAGKTCTDAIDRIRFRVLQFFHTTPEEYSVIFTSGATAAIKLLLESFFNPHHTGGGFVYTASNHTSIIGGREIARNAGAFVECLDITTAENLMKQPIELHDGCCENHALFTYPAQCNFSGSKYPLEWISLVEKGILNNSRKACYQWYTLLDAAGYCSTNDLNLTQISPDFVCLSFYKIFGYPTGLGALLVKNKSAAKLEKQYFGGGSVDIALPSKMIHQSRKCLHERFEDGTLPYLSIISLGHGFDMLQRFDLTMMQISLHVFYLAKFTVDQMKSLRHWNGEPVVAIYTDGDYNDSTTQGGIVAFNLKRSDQSYIGYMEVLHIADSYQIHLRTGCFCNIGACQRFLSISDDQLLANYQSGHVCGDDRDMIDGKPTGAVRISFGLSNSIKDASCLIRMIRENFLETHCMQNFNISSSQIEDKPMLMGIRVYPVKSCGAMVVNSWELTERGLYLDRHWMIITAAGTCLTQKQEPMLCLVMPTVQLENNLLTLTYNNNDPIQIHLNESNIDEYHMCRNKVCGDKVNGVDCGDKVADWLSYHLSRDGLRLIRQHRDDKRVGKLEGNRESQLTPAGSLSLVNQAQFLLINRNSVNWLSDRLQDDPDFDLTTLEDRFRANFIISGVSAFHELKWNQLEIGPVSFKVDGPCTRCQMICIDQKTGRKNRKPLTELSRALEGKHRFGIYCCQKDAGISATLQIGNTVTYKEHLN